MEIFGFFMVLLAIAVPVAAFVALSNSNKALREIETLKKEIKKLSAQKVSSPKTSTLQKLVESNNGTIKDTAHEPPPVSTQETEEYAVLSTLWTESKSYETGNLITVKFVLEANNGKPLNEHYNKARVSLIRKNDGKEREVISSKLVDVVDGQIMHEVFKTSREGRYQFILNYGPIGKETDESEEFSVTTKKSSEPTNESVSSEPTYKKAESSLAPQNISKQKESKDETISHDESLEIKLGTYWFVRIGVLLLLTGLATLAWFKKDFFLDLSAGTKVALFYTLSLGMGGVGLWLHRRKKELQNFGQVLIAGSFAGTYFTTYAAHIFEPVKIIHSPTLALVFLFLLGSLMILVAEKLKSQTIALFAIGTSYYATYVPLIHQGTISPWVILASNLILAIASIVFMTRNQWFKIPALSMGASYLGFFIWRFLEKSPDFLLVTLFLGALWMVYTVAIFICKHHEFSDNQRATFLTLNNASLFGFMTWEVFKLPESNFWVLALSIGLILIGCAFISSKILKNNPLTKNAYLVQGLSLATLGLMATKQSESIKGPILAAESLVLLFSSTRIKNILVQYAAVATSIAAVVFGFISINNNNADYLMSSLTITVFLLACGIVSAKKIEHKKENLLRDFTTFFIGAAILMFTSSLLYQFNHLDEGVTTNHFYNLLLFASAPMVGCASYYFLRTRELTLLGQIPFLFVSLFSLNFIYEHGSIFQNISILVITLSLVHWWKLQGHIIFTPINNRGKGLHISNCIEGFYSFCLITQIFSWSLSGTIDTADNGSIWLWLGPALSISLIAYSYMNKLKYLGLFSHLFLGFSCLVLINTCLDQNGEHPLLALIPISTIIGIVSFLKFWINRADSVNKYLKGAQNIYSAVLIILMISWIYNYTPDDYRSLVSIFLYIACNFTNIKNFIFDKKLFKPISLIFLVTAFIYLGEELTDKHASLFSLVGILGLLTVQQVTKRIKNSSLINPQIHNAIIICSSIAIFLWCSVKISDATPGFRTITWSGLAVINFLIGIGLKERWYRLVGLTILGISLLSLVPIIWDMPTELKIASLFVLGAVFVGLGYVYTRYKDHIKKFL